MGAKKINTFNLMVATPVSGTAVATSASQYIANLDNLFIQVRFSGTMTGTLVVQCSTDNILWDDLVFTPALAQPAGASLGYAIDLTQLASYYFRIQYTNASGAGTLTVNYNAKDLN